ncbi:MAG: hypothetical protein ACRC6V_02085 [Bacteroidales bacterium]
MLYMNSTLRNQQLYNLLHSIYTAPNDYLVIYSYGVFVGWTFKSGFVTDGFGSSEVDRLIVLGKELEKVRRKQIALLDIG